MNYRTEIAYLWWQENLLQEKAPQDESPPANSGPDSEPDDPKPVVADSELVGD